jgi:hypothetical protein
LATDSVKQTNVLSSMPPAAKACLPMKEINRWPAVYESFYLYVEGGLPRLKDRVYRQKKVVFKLEAKLDKTIEANYYNRALYNRDERRLAEEEGRLRLLRNVIEDTENASRNIVTLMSWLEWYKKLSVEEMREEIRRLQRPPEYMGIKGEWQKFKNILNSMRGRRRDNFLDRYLEVT